MKNLPEKGSNFMKWTAPKIKALKGEQRFAVLTAYDALSGRYADEAGIPLILVGDSLAMTVLGYETTLPVTMDEMVHHTAAVSRGVQNGLVVADMPFMSYQGTTEHAIENAGRFVKEAGARKCLKIYRQIGADSQKSKEKRRPLFRSSTPGE